MKEKTKNLILTVVLVILLVLCLTACSGKAKVDVDTFGLPAYDSAICEVEKENKFNLLNTTKEDFVAYVELLRQEGYTFYYEGDNLTEETAIDMDFWQGKKDDVVVNVYLMIDLETMTNYVSVTKVV